MVVEKEISDPQHTPQTGISTATGQQHLADETNTPQNTENATQNAPPVVTLSAIELAYRELQSTVDEATAIRFRDNVRPRILQSHITALAEDTDMVAGLEIADEGFRTKTTALVLQARRLKRHLERDLIDLDIAESTNGQQQLAVQLVPAEMKSTGIKLEPIKPPIFSGDVSRFRVYRSFMEENILNNGALTDTAKWIRLEGSVIGGPADLISTIPRTPETIAVAWSMLVGVYGGDDRPIFEMYDRLQKLPSATVLTSSLRLTHSKLEGMLLSLEQFGHEVNENKYIRHIYINKFPVDIAYQVQKTKDTPLAELRESIDRLLALRESVDQQAVPVAAPAPIPPLATLPLTEPQRPPPAPRRFFNAAPITERTRPRSDHTSSTSLRPPFSCIFCAGNHWNDDCTVYTTLTPRKERLMGKCLTCLRREHAGIPCTVKRRCFHCDGMDHNRSLCPVKFADKPQQPPPTVQASIVPEGNHHPATGYFLTFLAPATSKFTKTPVTVRIVVDTAGGSTIIRKEAAQKLQLPVLRTHSTEYTGLGDTRLVTSYKLGEPVVLRARDGTDIEVNAEMVDWIIPEVPTANVQRFRSRYPQFDDVHIPATGDGDPIDILIGSNSLVDFLAAERVVLVDDDTLLLPTKFGSLIMGRKSGQSSKVCHNLLINALKNPLDEMSKLDLVGLADLHANEIEEEQQAIQNFYDTVRFVNGRYSISWPWKSYPPQLDSNFGLALGRLRSLHKKLSTNPQLLYQYHEIIQTQLKEGIVEIVPDPHKPVPLLHYLPHHPILQPEKSTSVRPVIDAASKTTAAQKSLNDNILKGKNWLNNLVQTLIRFRLHETVITADIAKAFHQIAINESDRDVVRFFWLKDPSLPPEGDNLLILRFTRVAFGVSAAPFILSATITYHGKQQEPCEMLDLLLQNLYADNLVISLPSHIDASRFYAYAKQFFGSMSMNLTKWTSNKTALLEDIPEEDQQPDIVQSVLGLRWNRQEEVFSIKQPKLQNGSVPTRRLVAKEMARYFDPLGWATPIVLLAKNFFRIVWRETSDWDEPLAQKYAEEWAVIWKKLQEIEKIRLPRRYQLFSGEQEIQLHAFVDASATAYAIVVYLRAVQNDQVKLSIIAAKSRLTPAKTVTIPKLELIAVLLGSRFLQFVKEALNLEKEPETYVWSDSKCALSWIQHNKILPTAIEKYVREAKNCGISEYRYVPSEQNYADVATRGADYATLQELHWWTGPTWLYQQHNWPKNTVVSVPEILTSLLFQQKLTERVNIIEENTEAMAALNVTHFSSLTELLVKTGYMLRAVQRFVKRDFLRLQTYVDLRVAEMIWLRWDQNRVYALQGEPEAGEEFLLRNISVFRDPDGVIRCVTRVTNSALNLDAKSPILLVKNSWLTKLVILYVHEQSHHAGTNYTLASIRQKYWLPHGRRQVYKAIVNDCYKCRRQLAITYPNPPPAPLPEFRVLRSQRPFQITGVDTFGPFKVRYPQETGFVEQKRNVLIFTCATIRAVHLETVIEMCTEEISFGFRRFFARRGIPDKIVADNAGHFHELNGRMQELWKSYTQIPSVTKYFAEKRVMWEFTVEYAPWMGGIYERLIQSVKIAFDRTYGSKILTAAQFELAMIEIESLINSRPIGYVDQDPETPILTPNDFLRANYSALPTDLHIDPKEDLVNKLWKSSQAYLDEYWKHWSDQYLMILRDRNDQLPEQRRSAPYQPEKGELVIVKDPEKRRSAWKVAVVERAAPGKDGVVRAVQVREANGSKVIRAVVNLAPLRIKMGLPKVRDDQLTKNRQALVVWAPESGSQQNQLVERGTEEEYIIEEEVASPVEAENVVPVNVPNSECSNTSERIVAVPNVDRGSSETGATDAPITERGTSKNHATETARVTGPMGAVRRFRLPGNVVERATNEAGPAR